MYFVRAYAHTLVKYRTQVLPRTFSHRWPRRTFSFCDEISYGLYVARLDPGAYVIIAYVRPLRR